MRISPQTQALMLLASAVLGVAAGVVLDLLLIPAKFVKYEQAGRYNKKLPIVGNIGKAVIGVRMFAAVFSVLADTLFPICWSAAMLCVFYAFDDGIFRFFGIICSFIGFCVWRRTLSEPFCVLGGFIVYVLSALLAYTLLPFKLGIGFLCRAIEYLIYICWRKFAARKINRFDKCERMRLVAMADEGFGFEALFGEGSEKITGRKL